MEGEKYPRSGAYRTNRELIHGYADRRADEVDHTDIDALFGFAGDTYSTLSESEKNDIDHFIQYGTKRLAAGAVTSPLGRATVREHNVQSSLQNLAPNYSTPHDLIHVMFAYARTNGKSLIPAYMEVMTRGDQFTDPTAIQEEMMVDLLDKGGSQTAQDVFSIPDPYDLELFPHVPEIRKDYLSRLSRFESLKETDPLGFALGRYESLYAARFRPTNKDLIPEYEAAFEYILEHRDPEYVRIFTEKFNAAQEGREDPKYGFNTFERIMAPLLERLRKEPEA